MNIREKIAQQIGLLVIANAELEELVENQKKQLEELSQRLHNLSADVQTKPSGAPVP